MIGVGSNLNDESKNASSNLSSFGDTTNSDSLKQEEILRKFYSGEINFLICASEMEDSISSPSSVNLIIRLNCDSVDASFDYSTFIRTKSRATGKNSKCVFFIEKSNFSSFFAQFTRFKQIEQLLRNNYSKLIAENVKFAEISSKKKCLSPINAIEVINKYCIRLPSDSLTHLTPTRVLVSRVKESVTEFKFLFYLPINSGIREAIEGDWCEDKNKARINAAFKTCLVLLKHNELTDMLDPISKEMFYRQKHKMDSVDDLEWSPFNSHSAKANNQQIANYMSHRPGGSKRKQIYHRKMSPYLQSLQVTQLLIKIQIKSIFKELSIDF